MTTLDVGIGALLFAAALTQGVIGFGFGLVVMSTLPRLLTLQVALPVTAVYALVVAGSLFLRYRSHASWYELRPMILGAVFGLPLGVLAVRHLDADPCLRALGAFIILYVTYAAWPDRAALVPREAASRRWGSLAGILGGIFSGAFAAGGPPVIAYVTARRVSPSAFKGILQGFFFACSAALVVVLLSTNMITTATLGLNLLFAPLVVLGIWIGAHFGDRLHPALFRRAVLAVLLLLGLSYVIRGA